MMDKGYDKSRLIAYCISTYNRPRVIADFLEKSARSFLDAGIDIYIYDSSADDKTKEICSNSELTDELCYVHVSQEIELSAKVWSILCDDKLRDYKYIWASSDSIQYSTRGVERIISYVSAKEYDLVFLDNLSLYSSTSEIKEYYDCNSFFSENLWRSSLLGVALINNQTMLGQDIDLSFYKEVFCGEKLKGWAINYFYFNRITEIKTFCGACINIQGELRFSLYKRGNHWRKDAFKLLCETWVNVIEDLPSLYQNMERILKQSAYNAILGDYKQYLVLRSEHIFTLYIFLKYFKLWKRITYLSRMKIFLISIIPSAVIKLYNKHIIHIVLKNIKRIRTRNKYLVVYGAGLYGYKYCQLCQKYGIEIDFFCISNNRQDIAQFEGYKVMGFYDIDSQMLKECGFIIAMGPLFTKEVKRVLDVYLDQDQIFCDKTSKFMGSIDDDLGLKFIAGDAWV